MLTQFRFASLILLAAVFLSACSDSEPQASGPVAAPEVTVVTLQAQSVTLYREFSGRTRPYLIAEVRPQVNGIIDARLFMEGEMVTEGQALYQLDDALYRAEVNSAAASVERSRATLNAAQLLAGRAENLRRTGAISQQDYDNAITGLEEARASLAVAEATLEARRVALEHARITAPISGKIGISSVTRGALVTANQSAPLTTIQQLDPLYVDITQSASEWLQLRRQLESGVVSGNAGISMQLILEDGSQYQEQGRITFADVTVNPTTGSFVLRGEIPNPDGLLLPGMFVRAILSMGEVEGALLVPQRSVSRDPTGATHVMLVNGEGVIEQRTIVVSQTHGDQWLVDSGLQPGDRVVVEGLQKIRPGVPVQATELTPATPAGTQL